MYIVFQERINNAPGVVIILLVYHTGDPGLIPVEGKMFFLFILFHFFFWRGHGLIIIFTRKHERVWVFLICKKIHSFSDSNSSYCTKIYISMNADEYSKCHLKILNNSASIAHEH